MERNAYGYDQEKEPRIFLPSVVLEFVHNTIGHTIIGLHEVSSKPKPKTKPNPNPKLSCCCCCCFGEGRGVSFSFRLRVRIRFKFSFRVSLGFVLVVHSAVAEIS